MMETRLQSRLGELERRLRRVRLGRRLAGCWAAAAAAGVLLLLIQSLTGWNFRAAWLVPLAGGIAAAMIVRRRERRRPADFRSLVAMMERDRPELRHWLSAAAEQQPDPDTGRFGFLQLRVIEEVLQHRGTADWKHHLEERLASARNLNQAALLAFLAVTFLLGFAAFRQRPLLGAWNLPEVTVSPGDAELERGTGLVISARFGARPPAEATLVLRPASGLTQRLPLERPLADPVFGASLPEVAEDLVYHIEYGSNKTRDYRISVFDYPALLRSDAALQYPAYTGLTNQEFRDTRRISAVEGTRLNFRLELNKPVTRARFVSATQTLDLVVQSNAVALLDDFTLTHSARYALALLDADGRTNRFPFDFFLQSLPNRRPELKLSFPRGDPRVSCLEELQLQAEAADDFGLLQYGVGFGTAGADPQILDLGRAAPANEKRRFGHLLALEPLGVEPDQVVAYFVWADDFGPDGQPRRTYSDVFFAEIRPFEEIFRPDQSGGGQGQNAGQEGGGSSQARLAELQKQIVIATWKLQREKAGVATP